MLSARAVLAAAPCAPPRPLPTRRKPGEKPPAREHPDEILYSRRRTRVLRASEPRERQRDVVGLRPQVEPRTPAFDLPSERRRIDRPPAVRHHYDEDHISDLPNLRRSVRIGILHRNPSIDPAQLRQLKLETGPLSPAMSALLAMLNEYTGQSDRSHPATAASPL